MNPRRLFRLVATAEAVTWTLLVIGMVLKYVTRTTELGVRIGGGLHGLVFLAYVVVALAVWVDHRWSARTGVLALASALPPWATLLFERWVERPGNGGLPQTWRLADHEGAKGEHPTSPAERLLAAALRRPGLAVLVALVVIAAVFGVLLVLGPPVPSS